LKNRRTLLEPVETSQTSTLEQALPYMWNLHVMDPDPNRKFTLQKAKLVVFTRAVRELLTDFEMRVDIVKIKLQNLQCEALLHDVELASCLALCKTDNFKYPACKLQELWREGPMHPRS
ncbi:hypothetical protein cypCar_00011428, partial [Cyprinus carpio]